MFFYLINGISINVWCFFLTPLLVVMWNIPCVKNVILDRKLVFGQSFQMMRSDKPFSISMFLLRHILVYVSLIVISWQIQRIWSCNVIVDKRSVFDQTKSFLGIKFLICFWVTEQFFEWTLILLLLLLSKSFSFEGFFVIKSISFEVFSFNFLKFKTTFVKVIIHIGSFI